MVLQSHSKPLIHFGVDWEVTKVYRGWELTHKASGLGFGIYKTIKECHEKLDSVGLDKVVSLIKSGLETRKQARIQKRHDKRKGQIDAILCARNGFKTTKYSHTSEIQWIKDNRFKLRNGKTIYPLYAERERIRKENIQAIDTLNPASKYITNTLRYWTKERNKTIVAQGGRLMNSKSGRVIGAITKDKDI